MGSAILVYLAGPLFTQAEWQWNTTLSTMLRAMGLEVILPQDTARPMLTGETPFDAAGLFRANVGHLCRADVVLAVFDQPDPDSGTCWECGYAHRAGKPIIGLRTDIRRVSDGPKGRINLMLEFSCAGFVEVPCDKLEDVAWVAREVAKSISEVLAVKGGTRSQERPAN
jgi:nucleoside 2-deoxyribosyltransferase